MNSRRQVIDDFFNKYAAVFNKALNSEVSDVSQTAQLYSNCFVGASPAGVNCGKNDEQLRKAIVEGYAFYKNIGITSMEIKSKEITFLDDLHTMTKIRWISNFRKKDGSLGGIEFENFYFTQTRGNQPKVFAWITGDEQAVLREYGLI